MRPELGISSKAIAQINEVLVGQLHKMTDLSAGVAHAGKKSTLSSRRVQAAVRIHLPAELGKHAVSEGTKAVASSPRSSERRRAGRTNIGGRA